VIGSIIVGLDLSAGVIGLAPVLPGLPFHLIMGHINRPVQIFIGVHCFHFDESF